MEDTDRELISSPLTFPKQYASGSSLQNPLESHAADKDKTAVVDLTYPLLVGAVPADAATGPAYPPDERDSDS